MMSFTHPHAGISKNDFKQVEKFTSTTLLIVRIGPYTKVLPKK